VINRLVSTFRFKETVIPSGARDLQSAAVRKTGNYYRRVIAMIRNCRTVAATVLLAVLIVGDRSPASAQMWLPTAVKVADHLEVSVEGFAGPASGVQVVVQRLNKKTSEYEPISRSVTDGAGIAHFQDLERGKYALSTQMARDNDSVDIVVTKNVEPPLEVKLTLHWPAREVVHARHLQGSLVSFADGSDPSITLEGIRLTLLEGYSGREIGAQATASDGGFAFEGLSPGLYFLHVEESADSGIVRSWGRHDLKGDIPIALDPINAAAPDVIKLRISTCFDCGYGMMYKATR